MKKLITKLYASLFCISVGLSLGLTFNVEAGIFVYDGWEGPRNWYWRDRGVGGFKIETNEQARLGTRSIRIQLDHTTTEPWNYRSELACGAHGLQDAHDYAWVGTEYWYGLSVYLPDGFKCDSGDEIIMQFHGTPDFHLGNVIGGVCPAEA